MRAFRLVPTLALLALGVALSGCISDEGCITYERQTLTYRYDAATDELRVYHVYSGIYGSKGGATLTGTEQDQLQAAWAGEQIFLRDGFLDLGDLRAQFSAPERPGLSDAKRAALAADKVLSALLTDQMRISNGPFFVDEQERLCGAQRITVTHASEIFRAVNFAIRLEYLSRAADPDNGQRDRWARVAAAPAPFLAVDRNRVTIRQSFAPDDVPWFTKLGGELPNGTVSFSGDLATIAFGRAGSQTEEVSLALTGEYVPNAVAFAREQFGVAEKFDPVADASRFFGLIHP